MLHYNKVKRNLFFFKLKDCIAIKCLKVESLEAAAFLFLSFAQQKPPVILLL